MFPASKEISSPPVINNAPAIHLSRLYILCSRSSQFHISVSNQAGYFGTCTCVVQRKSKLLSQDLRLHLALKLSQNIVVKYQKQVWQMMISACGNFLRLGYFSRRYVIFFNESPMEQPRIRSVVDKIYAYHLGGLRSIRVSPFFLNLGVHNFSSYI